MWESPSLGHEHTRLVRSIHCVHVTLKRGVGTYDVEPQVMFRSNPDEKGFGLTQFRGLGKTGKNEMIIEFGAQGLANTWQFEWGITDNCPFEMRRFQVEVDKVVR